MSSHALVPDRARRGLRTAVVVVLAVVTVVLGFVPVVLQAVEPLQAHFTGAWYPWLVGVAGTIVAVALAAQKILTSPIVEQLLRDKAPSLAAESSVGSAYLEVLTLTAVERANLASLRDALDEGDPGRVALDRVLAR